MEKDNGRELLPDVLRGFAGILVVLGHCISDGSGEAYRVGQAFFGDRLYQFIYSFHMPLFMIVSGYLGWRGIERCVGGRDWMALFARKSSSLLVPVFFWVTLDYINAVFSDPVYGTLRPAKLAFLYFYNALGAFWFLWAVWWCFLVLSVVHYLFNDNVIIYALGFLTMFVLPDGLGLGAYKYMLPYYLAGHYAHGYLESEGQKFEKMPKIWMIVLNGLAFAGLFIYYNEDSFIYLTGYKLVGKDVARQLLIDVYRTAIGFAGSGFFILLWQYAIVGIDRANRAGRLKMKLGLGIMRELGKNSMGIYVLSRYPMGLVMRMMEPMARPSYAINLAEALLVLAILLPFSVIVGKIPVLKKVVGK